MRQKVKSFMEVVFLLCLMSGCTYNPLSTQNRLTGNAAGPIIGAAAGAGGLALIGAPRYLIALGGLGGGALGYYVTTLRYDAGGVVAVGGQVYQIGDYAGIDIPTDYLFDDNTARLLPGGSSVLDSVTAILRRYGNRSILVAGHTSGFDRQVREKSLSQQRAKVVVDYLREEGINAFEENSITLRKIDYVGYGHRFPIANHFQNDSIRQNSHILISIYPTKKQLKASPHKDVFKDIGALDDSGFKGRKKSCEDVGSC